MLSKLIVSGMSKCCLSLKIYHLLYYCVVYNYFDFLNKYFAVINNIIWKIVWICHSLHVKQKQFFVLYIYLCLFCISFISWSDMSSLSCAQSEQMRSSSVLLYISCSCNIFFANICSVLRNVESRVLSFHQQSLLNPHFAVWRHSVWSTSLLFVLSYHGWLVRVAVARQSHVTC